jgi:ferredoxin
LAKRSASKGGAVESDALSVRLLEVLCGRQAVARVERDLCAGAVTRNPAAAEGLALAGLRAASLAESGDAAAVTGSALPGTSCVHHVAAASTGGRGAFELSAGSPQEAVDHCLAAHLLSRKFERAGLCSLDPALAEQVALLELPGPALREALLDTEPLTTEPGAAPDRVVELAEQALHAVSAHTGRFVHVVRHTGEEPAEVVLVASGAGAAAVDELARTLSASGLRAGALSLSLVHPFPIQRVRAALCGAREVFVVEEAGRPAGLLAGVRAAAAEKAVVQRLDPAPSSEMMRALEAHWPERDFEASGRAPEPPPHRLVLAPAGPWGERLLFRVAAALGHLGPLRLGSRVRHEAGAVSLDWACEALPESGGDLLVASAAPLLDVRAALSLIRPTGAVLVVSAAQDSDALARALSAEARAAIREGDLHLSWVTQPPVGDYGVEADGDSSFYLAGAALAALRERAAPEALGAAAARLEQTGRVEAARALRAGIDALRVVDSAALDPARCAEEVDFRPAPSLPRMPAEPKKAHDIEERLRHIREFHLKGSDFAPRPRLPLRPAVLEGLADISGEYTLYPFALVRGQGTAPPAAARALRELLGDTLRAMQKPGRRARVLEDNLPRLIDEAARTLAEGELGVDLGSLLARAGRQLVGELALPEAKEKELLDELAELSRWLPGEAQVLDLRPATPLHVTLEVLDAARASLRRRFGDGLQELREKLRELLDLDRMASAEGRSAGALAAALGSSATQHLDAAALSRMLPKDPGSAVLAGARRKRIRGALAAIERYLGENDGVPRAILVRPQDVEVAVSLPLEERVHPDPLGAAVGLFDGVCRRMAELFRAVRAARLEVAGRYQPELHDAPLAQLDWEAFNAEELELVPPVVALTSGRRLRRCDQGALSELLRSSRAVHVVVLDEVGAADAAAQLSRFHLDLGYLVIAHREAFALASAMAKPERLVGRLLRMVSAHRPTVALYHLPALEPAALRSHMAQAALEGRACSDFCYDPDAGASWADRFDLSGNPQPARLWPLHEVPYLQGEVEQELELPLTFADAVALEPAYAHHYRPIPPEAWDESQVPLAEWLEQEDADTRDRSIPFLWMLDAAGLLQRVVVTRELALASGDRMRSWRVLQELGGYDNAFAARAAAAARQQVQTDAAELQRAHAEALAQARSDATRASMERLAAALVRPEGIGPILSGAAPAAAAPAVAAEPAPAAETPAAQEPAPAAPAPAVTEPYIDSVLCTTCNECTKINGQLFQYNAEKQAYIADASAGTFKQLVKAAELCPARCIHPGQPRSGDTTATPKLIERAAKFN